MVDERLYYRFWFRVQDMNWGSSSNHWAVWIKKEGGRGILVISSVSFFSFPLLPVTPMPDIPLSPLCSSSSSFHLHHTRGTTLPKPKELSQPIAAKLFHSTTPSSWWQFVQNLDLGQSKPPLFRWVGARIGGQNMPQIWLWTSPLNYFNFL